MNVIHIGDLVARKSYGGDVSFVVTNIIDREDGKKQYLLRGLMYRILADSTDDDLIRLPPRMVRMDMQRSIKAASRYAAKGEGTRSLFPIERIFGRLPINRVRRRTGKILHIDSSRDFMERCLDYYRQSDVTAVGKVYPESEQHYTVIRLLEQYRPDILVVTGHDALKKNSDNLASLDSYRNSRYYIESVNEARKFEADPDKLCIFAGACQSYYEAIMKAGANFASSPGRILINALDPAIVTNKIATTDSKKYVTPEEVAALTVSGSKGVGGIRTKGRMIIR